MIDVTPELLSDPLFRESVAESAYLRERTEEAAADREHVLDEGTVYYALAWESLSDWARRPYRTAVAEAFEALLRVP